MLQGASPSPQVDADFVQEWQLHAERQRQRDAEDRGAAPVEPAGLIDRWSPRSRSRRTGSVTLLRCVAGALVAAAVQGKLVGSV